MGKRVGGLAKCTSETYSVTCSPSSRRPPSLAFAQTIGQKKSEARLQHGSRLILKLATSFPVPVAVEKCVGPEQGWANVAASA